MVGIANEQSLAWSAAQHFRSAGADLAITYLNDMAKPFVEPLAQQVSAPIFLPCNSRSLDNSTRCSKRSERSGPVLTFCFMRSPGHGRRICTVA